MRSTCAFRFASPRSSGGGGEPLQARRPATTAGVPPAMSAEPAYVHRELFPLGPDPTPYRKLTADGVRVERLGAREVVVVEREAIRRLAEEAMVDINHLLRPGHLRQLAAILDDPEATGNDKFVAYDLLKNANIAAGGVLPMCQDTGTAIVMGKKGRAIVTDGSDEGAIAQGIRDAYLKKNLRYSQVAPLSMFEEVNTRSNLPAQIEIYAEGEDAFVDEFQSHGGSMVMLAKGNRSKEVREACQKHGGFYLGSIGGPAARLAQDCIRKVEVVEYPELGMEAIWRIEVENFPAFIVVDDKGNDFFRELNLG